ncbi:unnamed protein product [Blepharisma stoltei]|uniref:Uncharacterized protein n=1 Tax=Blepharisma stoltei TaxID=1481888 RepID=A0AAU9JYH7_9CILI|nr:unnamed protein product [Blepharisma stoltei]
MAKALFIIFAWAIGISFLIFYLFFEIDKYKPSLNGSSYLIYLEDYGFIKPYEKVSSQNTYPSEPSNYTGNTLSENSDLEIYKYQGYQACIPESFGYTHSDASINFRHIKYPTCTEKLNTQRKIIEIDIENNQLIMNCPKGKGWYYLGLNQDRELIGKDVYEEKIKKYPGHPVKLENNEEWAYGTCEENTFPLEGAAYANRPKLASKKRAKKIMENLQGEAYRDFKENQTRPLTVLVLTFDSISRRHFYRNLPKTKTFLSSLSPEKFRVFDYKIHNIIGDNSLPNVYSLLTGKSYDGVIEWEKDDNAKAKEDLLGSNSIWNYMQDKGWVTLFNAEFCDDYFSVKFGRKLNVDHIMTKFWCAAEKFSDYNDLGQFQRCIGNENSHFYTLNYTYQFVLNYQGINKWAHIMSLPGHEDSGTVVQTLDDDLSIFLKNILNTKDEVFIFLLADHGMRYGGWYKYIEGYMEHKLPMLFLIASTSLLNDIPGSIENLSYNSNRLVSKTDIHRTLKHLAHIPYYRNYEAKSLEYRRWHAVGHSVSLMMEKVPLWRECSDIGIDQVWCSCPILERVDKNAYANYSNTYSEAEYEVKKFIEDIADAMVFEINQETHGSHNYEGWHICQKISLKQIENVEWFRYTNGKHLFKLLISVNEDEEVRYESLAMISAYFLYPKSPRAGFPLYSVMNNGKKLLKLLYVSRKTPQSSLCKEICKEKSIIGNLCLCNKRDIIQYYSPKTITKIAHNYEFKIAKGKENCKDLCKSVNKTCDSVGMEILNSCQTLMEVTGCKFCQQDSNAYMPGLNKDVCILSTKKEFLCENNSDKYKRVCACKSIKTTYLI